MVKKWNERYLQNAAARLHGIEIERIYHDFHVFLNFVVSHTSILLHSTQPCFSTVAAAPPPMLFIQTYSVAQHHPHPTFTTYSSPSPPPPPGGPLLPICRALSISSQSNRFDAIPVELAILFLKTRKLSYTPCCTGSIGSPDVRSRPAIWPSACSSWRVATTNITSH